MLARPKQDECSRGHPFDEENTYVRPSDGRRQCRICQSARRARHAGRPVPTVVRERSSTLRKTSQYDIDLIRSCRRCGVDTRSDYCRDCRMVDPEFCRDGQTSRQREEAKVRERARWVEFMREVRIAGGQAGASDRRWKERQQRERNVG